MAQEWIRLVQHGKLLHIKVGLSPFFLMDLYLILHYNSCTATTLYCHFRNMEVETKDGSHLESLYALGPGRLIFKNVHSLADGQTVTNTVPFGFPNFNKKIVDFMQ